MARHESRDFCSVACSCAITVRWRWLGRETPRGFDLSPAVNRWEGPRPLVVLAHFVSRHLTRSTFTPCLRHE